jgi:hypothetical protein
VVADDSKVGGVGGPRDVTVRAEEDENDRFERGLTLILAGIRATRAP